MTSIYNTGTVTVTNGSAVVTGSGTAWAVAAITGGMFTRLGIAVPILSVDSDTQITLVYAWPGTTAAGAAYAIDRENSDASNIVDLYDKLSRVLVTLSLAGITPNSSGTLTDRAALTLAMGDKGYLFLHAEIGVAFAFYRWTGTAWDGPFAVANAVATGGVSSIVAGSGVTVDNTNPAIPVINATRPGATKTTPVDADEVSLFDVAASYGLKRLTWANLKSTLKTYFDTLYTSTATASREVLTSNRTYYVGYNMGSATVSIATPGVVTKAAHGLAAGSRVSFSILPNTKTATVSVASPAVVTMANSFAAGQPIVFATTGRLPKGLVAGTTYYVIATGLSGSSFQVAATVGGAAINTSNPTFTVTIASPGVVTETAHGRSTGDAIQLATTGALPTGLAAATTYYLNVIDANTYNLRLTPEGANINTTGTQSGTHSIVQFGTHYLSETGTLPTGITAGQDYWVIATGLTTNTFQFSATSGGAAINTTGSAAGTIVLKTGSDSNTGMVSASAATSFLTLQKAIDTAATLDLSIYSVTIQCASGVSISGASFRSLVGAGTVTLQGDTTFPANVLLSTTNATCISANGVLGKYIVTGFKFSAATSGYGISATAGSRIDVGVVEFGTCATAHVDAEGGGTAITFLNNYTISGGSTRHWFTTTGALIQCVSLTVSITGVPSLSSGFLIASRDGGALISSNAFNGSATGTRYVVTFTAWADVAGGGASYLPGNAAGAASTGGQYA